MQGHDFSANLVPALCSLVIPGLGQIIQGRALMGFFQFLLAFLLWFLILGWIVHVWSTVDAARFKPMV